jgi:hypothetical protein
MGKGILTVLSVLEILGLVAVLGLYLLAVSRGLKSIASQLAEVAGGARAVERQLRAVPDNIRQINAGLTDAATVLPGLADAVDRRTGART